MRLDHTTTDITNMHNVSTEGRKLTFEVAESIWQAMHDNLLTEYENGPINTIFEEILCLFHLNFTEIPIDLVASDFTQQVSNYLEKSLHKAGLQSPANTRNFLMAIAIQRNLLGIIPNANITEMCRNLLHWVVENNRVIDISDVITILWVGKLAVPEYEVPLIFSDEDFKTLPQFTGIFGFITSAAQIRLLWPDKFKLIPLDTLGSPEKVISGYYIVYEYLVRVIWGMEVIFADQVSIEKFDRTQESGSRLESTLPQLISY